MAANKLLRVQSLRANDLDIGTGKQIEFGRAWSDEFFEIPETRDQAVFNLTFEPLSESEMVIGEKKIELKLSEVTGRGDRKAYMNGENGYSQLKDFFLKTLKLTRENNLKDYFALYKRSESEYNLYFIPKLLYDNFITLFESVNPSVSIQKDLDESKQKELMPFQQIYYGAPGTGKSHIINEITDGEEVIRTTFHPDTDYSTFVGAYKPTTKEVPIYSPYGEKVVALKDEKGNPMMEDRIVYEFVEQAFIQAYIKAWKFYADIQDNQQPKKQFLVIEEINRGNCAQIFGDLFQLLDRNDAGFSDYPIKADEDMKKQLAKVFKGLTVAQADSINAGYRGRDVVEKVLSGEILLLPNNFYIWATMNTSDQSLFPIDSAFKRRWDWQYMPIGCGRDEQGNELNWRICANAKEYDWLSFLEKINEQIGVTTSSEDKKLGFFFCKAKNSVISAEAFAGKVVFYLWNDVFKDYGFEGPVFKDEDGSKLTFDKFYTTISKGKVVVQEEKVQLFLDNLGIVVVSETDNSDIVDEDGNAESSSTKDFSKYSINGEGVYSKGRVVQEAVKLYALNYSNQSDKEIVNAWLAMGVNVPKLIETQSDFERRVLNSRDLRIREKAKNVQLSNGNIIYVSNQFNVEHINDFISKVNAQDWNIKIAKVE